MGLRRKKKSGISAEQKRHSQEIQVVQRRLDRLEPRVNALELEVKLYRREQ